MTLREFWQALHAVLIYDRLLNVAHTSTIREETASVREQIRNFRNGK